MSILANALNYAREPESLYRALYQRKDGTLRGMTFAATDARSAARVADMWELNRAGGDKLLTVKLLRPLQHTRPQLTLV